MLLYASCSSFQGHVQWIPTLKFTESLRMRHYSNIALPKPLELSNYCSVIDTQSRWLLTARQVGRHGQLKHISLLNFSSLYPKANLYLSQCPSFTKKNKKKQKKQKNGGSVGSTVCWSQVSNTQEYGKILTDFGNQPIKIQIVRKFLFKRSELIPDSFG